MNPRKFIPIAEAVAALSKDPSTKVGAVIVDADGAILSVGYNGFPRGVADTEERLNDRPTKYALISHAESNAIAQAARHGIRLKGSTLVLTSLYPCSTCTKQIIQAGIELVVHPAIDVTNERWRAEWELASTMFVEAGVWTEQYE